MTDGALSPLQQELIKRIERTPGSTVATLTRDTEKPATVMSALNKIMQARRDIIYAVPRKSPDLSVSRTQNTFFRWEAGGAQPHQITRDRVHALRRLLQKKGPYSAKQIAQRLSILNPGDPWIPSEIEQYVKIFAMFEMHGKLIALSEASDPNNFWKRKPDQIRGEGEEGAVNWSELLILCVDFLNVLDMDRVKRTLQQQDSPYWAALRAPREGETPQGCKQRVIGEIENAIKRLQLKRKVKVRFGKPAAPPPCEPFV